MHPAKWICLSKMPKQPQLTGPISQGAVGVASGEPQRCRFPEEPGTQTTSEATSGATRQKSCWVPSSTPRGSRYHNHSVQNRSMRAEGNRSKSHCDRQQEKPGRRSCSSPPHLGMKEDSRIDAVGSAKQPSDLAEGRRSASPMTRHGLHVWAL